jgi:hypothetical protein
MANHVGKIAHQVKDTAGNLNVEVAEANKVSTQVVQFRTKRMGITHTQCT